MSLVMRPTLTALPENAWSEARSVLLLFFPPPPPS